MYICTFASKSLSHISLIVHPAPLMSNAPVPNKARYVMDGRCPAGVANAIDQEHGINSSQEPGIFIILIQWFNWCRAIHHYKIIFSLLNKTIGNKFRVCPLKRKFATLKFLTNPSYQ